MEDDNQYRDSFAETKPVITNMAPQSDNRFAVISLVLGVMSLLGCCVYGITGMIIGIIGIIFSIISLTKYKPSQGIAIAGLITSIAGLILGGIVFILIIIGASVM